MDYLRGRGGSCCSPHKRRKYPGEKGAYEGGKREGKAGLPGGRGLGNQNKVAAPEGGCTWEMPREPRADFQVQHLTLLLLGPLHVSPLCNLCRPCLEGSHGAFLCAFGTHSCTLCRHRCLLNVYTARYSRLLPGPARTLFTLGRGVPQE